MLNNSDIERLMLSSSSSVQGGHLSGVPIDAVTPDNDGDESKATLGLVALEF